MHMCLYANNYYKVVDILFGYSEVCAAAVTSSNRRSSFQSRFG